MRLGNKEVRPADAHDARRLRLGNGKGRPADAHDVWGVRLGNKEGRPADAHDVLGCGWAMGKGGQLMLMMFWGAAGQ